MALSALIGFLVIGGQAGQQPAQFTIETKVFEITGKFGINGRSIEKDAGLTRVHGVDETKVVRDKALKILSAPVIRTLDGMKAEISVASGSIYKISYVPKLNKESKVSLQMKVSMEDKADPTSTWQIEENTTLASGECYAIMAKPKSKPMLYLIKVHTDK